ncbi:MAG: GNAT family N-acetyltransferase [Clostridiales Family XIII bacterium]|jgi:GNAT superfamily N-acetyltransferase|nr:GNAT family N-acetyltransferase [Clostridiales Family XIII bacterium]
MITYIGEKNVAAFVNFLPQKSISDTTAKNSGNNVLFGFIDDDTDTACGIIVLDVSAKRVLVRYVYIAEAFRGRGYGKALLERAISFMGETGVDEIQIFIDSYENPEMTMMILEEGFLRFEFYNAETGVIPTYTATLGQLLHSKNFKGRLPDDGGAVGAHENIAFLDALPKGWIHSFNNSVIGNDAFFFDPIDLFVVDSRISIAAVSENSITGMIWASAGENSITVDGIYLTRQSQMFALSMVKAMLSAAKKYYKKDTLVTFAAVDSKVPALAEKLFEGVAFRIGGITGFRRYR